LESLVVLIPVSLFLGGLGLGAFFWTLRKGQYSDPEGDARRILTPDYDDAPKPAPTPERADRRDPPRSGSSGGR
jgi:cbb3-type cytochrome oxidase maturation protein